MNEPVPGTTPSLTRATRTQSDSMRRIQASGREVARSAGDLAYRFPITTAFGGALIASDAVGTLPVVGHNGLLVGVSALAAGMVTHRYITRHSYAHDRATTPPADVDRTLG